jgi:hypothetical protein
MASGKELQVKRMFESLAHMPAANVPEVTKLATTLEKLLNANVGVDTFFVDQSVVKLFATAAIEMWHRAIHSYLMSLSLTDTSHVWCSVSGYYSSHYSVRSLAHVLGIFQLYNKKKIIELDLTGAGNVCNVTGKGKEGREHELYWKMVKSQHPFNSEPLFTTNKDSGTQLSDAKHRERANYSDHVNRVPNFAPLDLPFLRERAERIAHISIQDPPIPNYSLYPEIENVQIVAYHRLVRVRNYLDEILGASVNYWNVHRDPPWAREIISYEIVEGDIADYINV